MQNLDKADLSGLEYQIDSLLTTIQQLKSENSHLRNELAHLKKEMIQAEEKRQLATHQINHLITRLKEAMA